MAATVSAWSKPGAWALDSEENEAELLQQHKVPSPVVAETSDFPSLSMAASKKMKKKKSQTMSLGQLAFHTTQPKVAAYQPKVFTPEEQLVLPKGPRERTQEELDQSRSNGFRSYSRDDQGQGRRQNGFNRDSDREFQPSRADETGNWAAAKKFSASSNGFERGDRGFFPGSQSRADDGGSWTSGKSFIPSEPRRYEKRSGFGFDNHSGAGADDEGNWTGKKNSFDSLRDRRGGFESNRDESIGTGGERPRLKLQPRTLPVVEEKRIETASSVKPVEEETKPKSNPFGAARPREEVLKEKGQDWKEIDKKLEATKLKESSDGSSFGKRGFFNGRERVQQENRAWRRPGSSDSRPQSSAGGSENGTIASESGHAKATGEEETLIWC